MFPTIRRVVAVAALFSALPLVAETSTWNIDPAHSGASFAIKHLGVSTVRGSFSGLKGTVVWDDQNAANCHVDATIDTTTVNTGQPKRDEHLKSADFFDVEKYPTMIFKSTSVTRDTNGGLKVVGELKLGGQTKPTTLYVSAPATPQKGMGGKTVSGFSAVGQIKRSDFNFGQKYTAPMLGDEVSLSIDLEVVKQ